MIKLFLIPLIGCGCLPTPRALSCESRTKYAHKSFKTHSLLIWLLTTRSFHNIWLNNDPNPFPDRDEPGGETDLINSVGLVWAFSTPIVGALMDILTRQVVETNYSKVTFSFLDFYNHCEKHQIEHDKLYKRYATLWPFHKIIMIDMAGLARALFCFCTVVWTRRSMRLNWYQNYLKKTFLFVVLTFQIHSLGCPNCNAINRNW